jgi:hypothetical protein
MADAFARRASRRLQMLLGDGDVGLRKRVFGSKSEQTNYHKLSRQWGDKYRRYHNLPFLLVFEVYDKQPLMFWAPDQHTTSTSSIADFFRFEYLTELERNRLKKTSIDYTLCDQNDEPLLCIEFDGLQDGFNLGQEYRSQVQPADTWRDQITTLKLRVAHGNMFPYFVVGFDQFEDLSPRVRLMLIDGIIGEVLAKRSVQRRVNEGLDVTSFGLSDDEFSALPPDDRQELIQDWLIGVEVEADMTNNPVCAEKWRLAEELGVFSSGHYPKHKPANATFDTAILLGSEAVVHTEDLGEVRRTVRLPNFKTPGFGGLTLLDEMASLVALDAVRLEREKRAAPVGHS